MTLGLGLALLLGQGGFGPFGSREAPLTADAVAEVSEPHPDRPTSNPLYVAFDVYRLTMTVFDGPRCAHRPVCSVYALRAVQRHGLVGVFLAIDRLWRQDESSGIRELEMEYEEGRPFFKDPLELSDFWFRDP